MIPNIVHFIFGLQEDFGGKDFSFLHFLAVATVAAVNKPERIYLHHHYEPRGLWWERAKPYLTLNRISVPEHVFGNPIEHFAHKTDVIRLEQLLEYGGIYLDMDVVCVNTLRGLRTQECVMAREPLVGLCNAVILARPGSAFIAKWYDRYRSFDQSQWNHHSIVLPQLLAAENPELITTLDNDAFFFPMFNDPAHILWCSRSEALADISIGGEMYKRVRKQIKRTLKRREWKEFYPPISHYRRGEYAHLRRLRRAYCIHLWEQLWWDDYLAQLSPADIVSGQNNFAKVMRYALVGSEVLELLHGDVD